MQNCPKCRSANIRSNKIGEAILNNVTDAGQVARNVAHPGFAFMAVSIWGGMQAINAFRRDWRCNDCRHRFS